MPTKEENMDGPKSNSQRINYSDKAISKWERGESVPDVITLMLLAKEFDTSINELVTVHGLEQTESKLHRVDRKVILRLTNVLVWFIALLAFVVIKSFSLPFWWTPFVFAVPITSIVELCIRCAWKDFRHNKLLISLIAWGSLCSLFVVVLILFHKTYWLIFLLGIPGQIAILLWFKMYIPIEESPVICTEKEDNNE